MRSFCTREWWCGEDTKIRSIKTTILQNCSHPSWQGQLKSKAWAILMKLRDRRQKTFEFINRICLLISNPLSLPLINRQPWFFMIQRHYFIHYISLSSSYTVYVLFIYLYYTYFILVYYTSTVYYTLIKNIYDQNLYFTLALFPPYCLCDSELFKISRALVNQELRAC